MLALSLLTGAPKTFDGKSLGTVKHPIPTEKIYICGIDYIFVYPLSHLWLLAFVFGYSDVVTFLRFQVFATLMTGNVIQAAIAISVGKYEAVGYFFFIVVTSTLLGSFTSCYLHEYFRDRAKTYAFIITLFTLSLIFTDLVDGYVIHAKTATMWLVAVVCYTGGVLVHWSMKLGYTTAFLTQNMHRAGEAFFRVIYGIDLGGPKLRGDALMIVTSITVFAIGGTAGAIVVEYMTRRFSLMPCAALYPLHLWFSGYLGINVSSILKSYFTVESLPPATSQSSGEDNSDPSTNLAVGSFSRSTRSRPSYGLIAVDHRLTDADIEELHAGNIFTPFGSVRPSSARQRASSAWDRADSTNMTAAEYRRSTNQNRFRSSSVSLSMQETLSDSRTALQPPGLPHVPEGDETVSTGVYSV